MKKFILFLIVFIVCVFGVYQVKADEEPVTEPEVVEEEFTEEDFKAIVEEYLSKYFEKETIEKIISWFVDGGVLTALFFVYLKYRKFKNKTIEELVTDFNNNVDKRMKENFDKLSEEQINKITKAIDDLEKSNETMMKVLVLMQDNTAKGKAALIDYLGSKTENEEIKDAVEEVNASLEEQEKIKTEVNEKVSGEYERIF